VKVWRLPQAWCLALKAVRLALLRFGQLQGLFVALALHPATCRRRGLLQVASVWAMCRLQGLAELAEV
jgi:hypothetical protein